METNRVVLQYQPIVNSTTGEHEFYECLLRIVDNRGYKLSASPHIQAAEDYGVIRTVDKFVLTKAVELLERDEDIKLHVNISGATITDTEWVEFVKRLFYKKDFFGRLTFEITESSIIKNFKEASFLIRELNELGCGISIDDFGSGYNSYVQLKNINATSVKIGGEYIRDIMDNRNNMLFVKVLIELAKNLRLKTIAEYVDNERVITLLKELGVDYFQGSLFTR
ncbi:EAL domain-containing protein [Candidatus Bandiella euplotis]|nr:EAL domain-containing protein [Candidatus Bandiella woodruffii]